MSDAYCNGKISTSDGSMSRVIADIDECGFFYNTTGAPRNGNSLNQTCAIGEQGQFSGFITGLSEESQYYFTSYIKIRGEYFYGDVQQFKTLRDKEPGSVSADSIRRWNDRLDYDEYLAECLYGFFIAEAAENSFYGPLATETQNLWYSLNHIGMIVSVSLENGYYEEAEKRYLEFLPLEKRVQELWEKYYKEMINRHKIRRNIESTVIEPNVHK